VVNGPQGPAGLATTGFPQRGVLDVPAGESEVAGTHGLYQVGERIAALIDPVALLTPAAIGGQDFRADLASVTAS
jgi:hypothetical protein